MKKHVKVYITYFNYVIDDHIPCECCKARAVDIHHLEARGSGFKERANNRKNTARKKD